MTSRLVERFKILKKLGFKTGMVVQSVYGPEIIMDIDVTGNNVRLKECSVQRERYTGHILSFEQFINEYKLSPPLVQALYGIKGRKSC